MEEQSICDPQLAEADTENNVIPHNKLASSSDADTVINTNNTNSSQIEGDLGEGELLKGLLTDEYCHVCEAVLLFESQKISHYEGKKHAQKLRLYLQTKKDEKLNKDPASGLQRGVTMDRERFCELCSMVFSSPVVARQHYEGKVHAKNLRKQGLHPTTQPTVTTAQRGPDLTLLGPTTDQRTMEDDGGKGPHQDSLEVDLNDPNKHCRLCAASFNNPHMAQQHYSGRKHQRNHSRQQMLRDLGEDAQQANSYTCPVCNIELNSVEMFQAHMQGNKHQIKEKKVADLCKSQQKVYDNFADELADYVQVQKARGLAPKTGIDVCDRDGQKERTEEGEEGGRDLSKGDGTEVNKAVPRLPPSSHPPYNPYTAAFYPPQGWCPPYQARPTHFGFGGNTHYPHLPTQPLLPGTASPGFIDWSTTRARGSGTGRGTGRGRGRGRGRGKDHPSPSSSSSSYTSSTSNSSSSSSSSDSSDSDYRRKRRRKRKSRRERERRVREDSDEEERRRSKGGKRIRDDDSEGRRGREDDTEVEEERRRRRERKRPSQSKRQGEGHRAKRSRAQEEEMEGRRVEKEESMEGRVGKGEETELHMQAEVKESEEREQAKQSKTKHRKEKKRTKEKVDTRTEEEKLWDESLGL